MNNEILLAEATSIARHGLGHDWPVEDCRDEIIDRLRLPPSVADTITLAVLRERQEQDITQTHADIVYDTIRHYYYEEDHQHD